MVVQACVGGFRWLFFFVSVYLLLLYLFLHLGAGLYGVGVVRWRLDAGEVFAAILFVSIYFCFCIPSSLWVGRWSCAGMVDRLGGKILVDIHFCICLFFAFVSFPSWGLNCMVLELCGSDSVGPLLLGWMSVALGSVPINFGKWQGSMRGEYSVLSFGRRSVCSRSCSRAAPHLSFARMVRWRGKVCVGGGALVAIFCVCYLLQLCLFLPLGLGCMGRSCAGMVDRLVCGRRKDFIGWKWRGGRSLCGEVDSGGGHDMAGAGGKGGDIPFAGSGRGRSPAEKRAQNGSNVGYGWNGEVEKEERSKIPSVGRGFVP